MAVRWRYRVEYGLLRFWAAALNALPYRLALLVAAALAAGAYRMARRRAAEARRRIAEVFPEKSAREVGRIARRALRNLFFSGIETLRFARAGDAWIARHVNIGNFPEVVEARLERGRGALLVIPHMGNWEMAGLIAARRGHPMFFLVGRQRNPLAESFMNRARAATGVVVITRDEHAVRHVLRNLRAGRIFGILPDVRMKTPGVPVTFLGKPMDLPGGVGLFARRTGIPVFIGYVRREGWTRHVWEFQPPLWADPAADKEADDRRLSQAVADSFSEVIRRFPDQYFWYNKRWILDPRAPATAGEAAAGG